MLPPIVIFTTIDGVQLGWGLDHSNCRPHLGTVFASATDSLPAVGQIQAIELFERRRMTREGPIAGCYKATTARLCFPMLQRSPCILNVFRGYPFLTWSQTPFSAVVAIADGTLQHAMVEEDESGEKKTRENHLPVYGC
jgi:hypothetical protein